ncbi:hypothetical protein [Bacillus badius]|uniref:Phage protein n=1 Tax=Bacillus badius TaxID=1455 RepID=A0ABR5AXY5_BACBA|nr:hypothetical protein [Bacillus badius]KIL79573.1 hypothetical protein SD77_2027 [Bacillus badius]MED4716268.1 hypothetical protein [Bacillus badius]
MNDYYFEGYLEKHDDGFFYFSGNRLLSSQEIEMKIKDDWVLHTITSVGEGDYVIHPTHNNESRMAERGKARMDVREYIWRKQPNKTREKSPNYGLLIDVLNQNGIRLKGNEFKAIFLAMDLITIYDTTKELAIKHAAVEYSVPQKLIKEFIKETNIQSKQEKEIRQQKAIAAKEEKRISDEIKRRI